MSPLSLRPEPASQFHVVLRGYDRAQVDRYLTRLGQLEPGEAPPPPPDFAVVLKGYHPMQIDSHIKRLRAVLSVPYMSLPAPDFAGSEYGYDPVQVDDWVVLALGRIAELQATVDRLSATE